LADLLQGVVANQRSAIGRAITLVESRLPAHRLQARELLRQLPPGSAHRIGITGPPGAGKSSLIESLGLLAIERGHRVAVLAIDPSSTQSGGSILGDKTRMEQLSINDQAFVRPSPTSGTLGGVARRTRECVAVLEAAGYTLVLVETVGVGQSETAVAELVDTVLLVALPGSGDELQGIKRGLMESADLVFVNKADGDGLRAARLAAGQISHSLRLLPPRQPGWTPPVELGSALSGAGLSELWDRLQSHQAFLRERSMLDQLHDRLYANLAVAEQLPELRRRVAASDLPPDEAGELLIQATGWFSVER
jgi:LAO/AO transport system kinase